VQFRHDGAVELGEKFGGSGELTLFNFGESIAKYTGLLFDVL
jgi:hypothetical protein